MKPVDVWKIHQSMVKEFSQGYCLHPDASSAHCSAMARSHTIQKRGGLISIAENGHVLSVVDAAKQLNKHGGKFVLPSVGINSASTFPGFCNTHDTTMFREAEVGAVEINRRTAFLLSYRGVARELFNKDVSLRLFPTMQEGDKGTPFEYQAVYQTYLNDRRAGTEAGKTDCRLMLDRYADIFRRGAYDEFNFFAVRFDSALPVVSCGAILPEYDLEGNDLQDILAQGVSVEHLAFNLAALNGTSVAIFGWLKNDSAGRRLAASFARISLRDKANAAVLFAFQHLENTYVRPSWWSGLEPRQRDQALEYIMAGMPSHEFSHDDIALSHEHVSLVNGAVLAEFGKENL